MARSDELAQESLEMLLDTICNTFGAVLFIAMLVVTLVDPNAQEQTDKGDIATEILEAETEINAIQIEADRLKLVLQQQEELKDRYSDPQSAALAASVQKIQNEQAKLVQDRAGRLAHLARTDHQNAQTREQIRNQQQALIQAQQAAATAAAKLSDIAAKKSRQAKTPKTVRLSTATIGTILKGGVWYCIVRPDRAGTMRINDAHCETMVNGAHKTLKPRNGAGVNVRNATGSIVPFRPADPQLHHFTIFVYRDSYKEYGAVKESLAKAGFRIELILMADDDFPVFGPGGQRDRWGA